MVVHRCFVAFCTAAPREMNCDSPHPSFLPHPPSFMPSKSIPVSIEMNCKRTAAVPTVSWPSCSAPATTPKRPKFYQNGTWSLKTKDSIWQGKRALIDSIIFEEPKIHTWVLTRPFCSMVNFPPAQILQGSTQTIENGNVGVEPRVQLGWPVFCQFLPLFALPRLQVPPSRGKQTLQL